jgi:hypothetical protein
MDVPEYLDFDLELAPHGQDYVARVLSSPRGEAEAIVHFPFDADRLENVILKLGRTRSGVRRIGSPQQQLARDFGAALYDAVFTDEVGTCFRRSLDEADRQRKGLRVRLRLADAPNLANVPWEYLYSTGLRRFLVLSTQTPVVRYLDLPSDVPTLSVTAPLKVLLVVCAPTDLAMLDTAREVDNLRDAVRELTDRGLVEIHPLPIPTLGALRQALRREEYHVLHFVGHGAFDESADDGVLAFENDAGMSHRVFGGDLGTLLHDHRTLRLAVLNACEGARGSPQDPFAGVAQSLVVQGLPAVVAMQFEITDAAAIVFSHEFYTALSDGYPVDAALADGRKAVFGSDNDVEWGTPVLYLRARDARIFDVTPPPATTGSAPTAPEPAPDPAAEAAPTTTGSALTALEPIAATTEPAAAVPRTMTEPVSGISSSEASTVPLTTPRAPQGPRRSRPVLLGVASLALVAVVALVLFVVLRSNPDSPGGTTEPTATPTPPTTSPTTPPTTSPTTPAVGPWGSVQDLADAWKAQIPATPRGTGDAGQTCKSVPAQSNYSTAKILCNFPSGQVVTALRYASEHDRGLRLAELSAEAGARTTSWQAGSDSGRLVTNTTSDGDPSRWWTSEQHPAYAMFVRWPHHSAQQLADWWTERAPF